MTLKDFFNDLYRPLRLRGKSPKTVLLYNCLLRTFGRWLGRDGTLADLDELVLARYLEHRSTKVAPLTIEHERQQLMALAGLAWERRLLEVKPTCPPGVIPQKAPMAWSIEQMAHLMAVAGDPKNYYRLADFYTRLFPALIAVVWETGERIGAVRDVDRADFTRPHLLVKSEFRKGRKRDRVYTLSPATCDRLDALPPSEDGKLFQWPFDRNYLQIAFRRVVKKAGLAVPGKKRLLFHQIRRTALTHFQAAGGNACEMADHSSDKITKRWYLDPRVCESGIKPCDVLPTIDAAKSA
jgi:integrase